MYSAIKQVSKKKLSCKKFYAAFKEAFISGSVADFITRELSVAHRKVLNRFLQSQNLHLDIWLKNKTLSIDSEVSDRSVQYATQRLHKCGLIKKSHRFLPDGRQIANGYEVNKIFHNLDLRRSLAPVFSALSFIALTTLLTTEIICTPPEQDIYEHLCDPNSSFFINTDLLFDNQYKKDKNITALGTHHPPNDGKPLKTKLKKLDKQTPNKKLQPVIWCESCTCSLQKYTHSYNFGCAEFFKYYSSNNNKKSKDSYEF